jgi:hypothetical protein
MAAPQPPDTLTPSCEGQKESSRMQSAYLLTLVAAYRRKE